jgi:hypothetical protein
MRFSVIDFVAAGKFGASSETWRSTAFCTAILRQSREKCFTLLTGNRARNRCDPGENAFHFRYQIFFTLRRDGERQEHEQACWYESVLINDESSAKSRNFTNPMPGVEAAGGPGIAMAAPESP